MFYTDAICLDVSYVPPLTHITPKELIQACSKARLNVAKGDTVLLRTGHYEKYFGKKKWLTYYAGLDREACIWLWEKGTVNVGIDAPSLDTPTDKLYPAHTILKEKRLIHMENLANLHKVVGKRFKFIGFPLKIRGATGSPIRAVAIVEE
jgi:kynurenine formamidase